MKRKIFAVVCVLMLSASALTWAVGPEWLVIVDENGVDLIDDGHPDVTLCIYGEYNDYKNTAQQ